MSVAFHSENIEMEEEGEAIYSNVDNTPFQKQQPHKIPQSVTSASSERKSSSRLPVVAVGLLGLLLLAGIGVGVYVSVKASAKMEAINANTGMISALLAQLSTLEMRLNATEKHNAVSVKASAKMEEALLAQLSTLEMRLNAIEKHNADQPKVAFSAGSLHNDGYVGPFGSTTTLVYQKVFTNIGNAYNTSTGFFRAPVKGVYCFRFTAANKGSSEHVRIYMYKNNQHLIYNYGYNNHTKYEYISNGVIVEMGQGDTVDMRLEGGSYRLSDFSSSSHNTFSGFLLYSM